MVNFIPRVFGELLDFYNRATEVVLAPHIERFLHEHVAPFLEVVAVGVEQGGQTNFVDVVVNAIGGKQEEVVFCEVGSGVVDARLVIESHRAGKVVLLGANLHTVVGGELFKLAVTKSVDPRVANMKKVRRVRL